jgi:hypothetical protein
MSAAALAVQISPAAPIETVYAARCEAQALLFIDGQLSLHEAVDELQAYAEQSGLIDLIGQDEAQRIMGEAFAAADLPPEADHELSQACEREIMLRAANLVQQWELADPRDRWQHAGEARPKPSAVPPRREPYELLEVVKQAFWFVATREPEKLKAWLARHPDDAPALHKIWKARRCS